MAKNVIPDNKTRDAVIAEPSGGGIAGGTPKRADTLNGQPRTKNFAGGSANYSKHTTSNIGQAPPPNNPYRSDEK